jgi:hypothetical protein
MQIARGNSRFRVSGDFLLGFDGQSLIRYLGEGLEIEIPGEVEAICRRLSLGLTHTFGELRRRHFPGTSPFIRFAFDRL